jgi:hypothetical protein
MTAAGQPWPWPARERQHARPTTRERHPAGWPPIHRHFARERAGNEREAFQDAQRAWVWATDHDCCLRSGGGGRVEGCGRVLCTRPFRGARQPRQMPAMLSLRTCHDQVMTKHFSATVRPTCAGGGPFRESPCGGRLAVLRMGLILQSVRPSCSCSPRSRHSVLTQL